MPIKVVVECNPDEILVKALGLGRKEVRHQGNKGDVCNYLEKEGAKIGMVDEDPGSAQPKYLNSFELLEEKFEVRKLLNKKLDQIILIIKPRLEEWILSQCMKSKVNPRDFNLPADAKGLKKVINLKLNKFNDLVIKLKEVENPGLSYLQSIINEGHK